MRPTPLALLFATMITIPASADPPPTPNTNTTAPTPFRLPTLDNKPIPIAPNQRLFHLPMRFAKAESFYRALYHDTPTIRFIQSHDDTGRTLTLESHDPHAAWARATLHESLADTTIEVTPLVRLHPETIESHTPHPLVQYVLPPSPEVQNQANSIDHLPTH